MNKPHIVVLGAGYGGILTVVKLQKLLHDNEAAITLVNKYDYHFQTSCLHENAAGTLHQDRSKIKIKDIINRSKINFIIDEVVSIKSNAKKLKLKNQEIHYDLLVIGLGFEPATEGIPGLAEYAHSITDINSARFIREHMEYNLAKYAKDEEKDSSRLNIVIGGGITAVEFAGELINQIPIMCKEYDVEKALVNVYMLEENASFLPDFDEKLVNYAVNSLQSRGVEMIHGAVINACHEDRVTYVKDGKEYSIPSHTFIWAGGTKANAVVENSGMTMVNGKVEVRASLQSSQDSAIFVVGDCAYIADENGKEISPTAKIAIEEADTAARNIIKCLRDEELVSFRPAKQEVMATLGKDDGVAVLQNRSLFGWKAVLMKRLADNRYLYELGGLNLLLKKGKFHIL